MNDDIERFQLPTTSPPPSVPTPEVEEEPEGEMVEEVEEEPEEEKDELADLFEVPQPEDNDMAIDDLFTLPNEEDDDLSDLTDVSTEDIMGGEPIPKPKYKVVRRIRRTGKRYIPPPSMGGVRI